MKIMREIILILIVVLVLLWGYKDAKTKELILENQNRINYNVSVVAEQLKIDDIIIK